MKREIGIIGTCTRAIIGIWLVVSVVSGQVVRGPFRPLTWILGLIVFPGMFLAWQWARARRNPARFEATGPHRFCHQCCHLLLLLAFRPSVALLVIRRGASLLWPVDVSGGHPWLRRLRGAGFFELAAQAR